VLFSFAGERPAKEKPTAAAAASLTQPSSAAGKLVFERPLSQPVKKIAFLCALSASAVRAPCRAGRPSYVDGNLAKKKGTGKTPVPLNFILR
jgi:hypothetical protein